MEQGRCEEESGTVTMIRGNSRVNLGATIVLAVMTIGSGAFAQTSGTPQAKAVGEIKSLGEGVLVLATDEGKSVNVSLPATVRVVRIAPGATDLKGATPITPQALQVGDRVLVRGTASEDAKALAATLVVVMKQSDVAARQQQEREDWQKRGIGGLVSAVDPAAKTVTISTIGLSGAKKTVIQTTEKTVVRRYAANSVKFDDAKPSSLSDIHAGDQLRARGTKNDDGTQFAAEEIVAGTFRNIAGTVSTVNAADSSITMMDLISKKSVTVRVTPDSQLRKLPQPMAQRIAMRLKGQTPEGGPPPGGTAGGPPPGAQGTRPQGEPQQGAPGGPGGFGGGGGRAGGGDLQQMLSRLPAVTIGDFQKGDAVILVSTEGNNSEVTAITMVGGVEPILTAAPGAQAMMLSPWSLGGGQGESQ
jgi:co-chaperonin GroES (HSP10)